MKDSEVLVKVFDPGRLLEAWQQVRKNAGAAGIDRSVRAWLYSRFLPDLMVRLPIEERYT